MKKSTLGFGTLLVVGALFIGVMLLINPLLRGVQLDLTADNIHTISPGTERIVRSLKEPVNLYLFYSERTAAAQPDLKNHGTHVQELLEELVTRSNGKLTLKVIDPQPYSEEEDRATELGISSVPVNAEGEKLYLGLAATNSTDGQESIPFLDPSLESQLEYDVAKLINKLSSAHKPVVGWLSSLPMQGDVDMQTGRPRPAWVVFGQLEQLYTGHTLEPTLTSIGADVDVLVLVHPKELPPAALYAIDQYAMRGGHIVAFVDPNAQGDQSGADPNNPMAQFSVDKSSHLEPLLAAWGIDFKSDQVVVDLERGLSVPVREGEPPQQHIAVLGFNESSMAKDVITAQLGSINMITAGSLKAVPKSTLKFEPLIQTSTQAGLLPAQRFAVMSDPASLRDGFKPTGQFTVAARVSGNAVSAFPGGPPAGVSAAPDALKTSAKPLNVVVVADTDFLSDYTWVEVRNFMGQTIAQPFAHNGEFVWNTIDNLAGSNDLISIRGRASYSRPFDRVEALRSSADASARAKDEQLKTELTQTEAKLTKLQSAQPNGSDAIVSADVAHEIERFQKERLRLRKEQRAVKAELGKDIRTLGMWVKAINIGLMPVLVAAFGLLVASWRKRRRHAIAMLRQPQAGSGAAS
jgi:ABC-type uncharacterized transport system involved in gliding motility auxiliary subunit